MSLNIWYYTAQAFQKRIISSKKLFWMNSNLNFVCQTVKSQFCCPVQGVRTYSHCLFTVEEETQGFHSLKLFKTQAIICVYSQKLNLDRLTWDTVFTTINITNNRKHVLTLVYSWIKSDHRTFVLQYIHDHIRQSVDKIWSLFYKNILTCLHKAQKKLKTKIFHQNNSTPAILTESFLYTNYMFF